MATYFVSQAGAGLANGSSGNPWSLATFNGFNSGPGLPGPGDTVIFSGTITGAVNPTGTATQGTSGNPVVLDFVTNAVIISGTISITSRSFVTYLGGTFSSRTSGTLIKINGGPGVISTGIIIDGFQFTGTSTGIVDFVDWGQASNDSSYGDLTTSTIRNCHIDNICHFINASNPNSHDITIVNNFMRSNTNTTDQTDIITIADAQHITITGNYIYQQSPGSQTNSRHNDNIQTFQNGSGNNGPPGNWVINYNWIQINCGAGGDGSNSWMMMENMNGTVEVYGNVFANTGTNGSTNGMVFDSNVSGFVVHCYNNTFCCFNNQQNCFNVLSPGTFFCQNNIMQGGGTGSEQAVITMTQGGTWDYNFVNNVGGISINGTHGSSANPQMTNFATSGLDPSLQSTSPCKGVGNPAIGTTYNQGIGAGSTFPNPTLVSRTSSWDVGAYQTGGSSPPLNPGAHGSTNVAAVVAPRRILRPLHSLQRF